MSNAERVRSYRERHAVRIATLEELVARYQERYGPLDEISAE